MFYDLAQVGGVILLVTVVVNILKHFGVVKNGEKVANTAQTVISILLTLVGMFAPDLLDFVPFIDKTAELLAELGAMVLPAYLIIVKIGNLFHDTMTKIPVVAPVLAKRITA